MNDEQCEEARLPLRTDDQMIGHVRAYNSQPYVEFRTTFFTITIIITLFLILVLCFLCGF